MANRSRSDYTTLNLFAGIGGYILNTLLGLVCRMVFTRTLVEDYLGVNGLFGNILSMLSLAELGIGTAIVYALYKPLAEDDRPKIASLVKFYGQCYRVVGIVVAVAGLCMMPLLDVLIREQPQIRESLYTLYLLHLFNTASSYFFSYRSSLLAAAQQNYLVTGLSYLVTIAQSIVQMVLLFLTHDYLAYLLVQTAGSLIYNILISRIAKKRYPYIAAPDIAPLGREEKAGLIRNVRALVIWKLSGLLVNQVDNVIITFFKGLATVGLASNYTLLSGTLTSMINLVFSSLSASVGNHNALETPERKQTLFNAINLANFWLFGWAAIGICVVSTDIVRLFFGERYMLPASIPFVIALNFYMVGIQNAVWTYKNTMGLFRQGRYLLFGTAALNLIFSVWLGKLWGLFGILLATAIARVCTNTWYDSYAVHRYGFGISVRPYYARRLRYLAIVSVTGASCYYLCSLLSCGLVGKVISELLICSVIPNGVFFLCFRNSPEFAYLERYARGAVSGVIGAVRSRLSR